MTPIPAGRRFARAIVNLGLNPEVDSPTAAKVRLTNVLSAVFIAVDCVYCALFYLLRMPHFAALALQPGVVLVGILALNRFGFYSAARVAWVLNAALAVYVFSAALGPDAGVHYWFVPTMFMPFVLFTLAERRFLLPSFALAFGAFLVLWFTHFRYSLIEPAALSQPLSRSQTRVLSTFMVLGAFTNAFGVIWYLVHIYEALVEQTLRVKQASLNAARLASLGEMSGGIAHEINNPVGIIQGKAYQLLRLLRTTPLDAAEAALNVQKIIVETERVAKIVKGLRAFSRSGEKDPMLPADLRAIVNDVLGLCAERFRSQRVELTVEITPGLSIACRSVQIAQVLSNLLSNAFDAVEQLAQDELRWVRVAACRIESGVRITVADGGPGIAPQVRDKIMQPFFTTKEVGRGTGLGLSISKGIIEDHGGNLTLDTTAPETRFVIELPAALAAPAKQP